MSTKELEEEAKEIRSNLINVLFWSRKPGDFVRKWSGACIPGASFTGTVREWYETLNETIIDAFGGDTRPGQKSVIVSPDVLTMLESGMLFKPTLIMDPADEIKDESFYLAGSMYNRYRVYCDHFFPRNKILCHNHRNGMSATIHILNLNII